MDRQSAFSYRCNQCGRCCHNQAITLSPVDVIAIARVCGISTGDAVARYTSRRGSLLRFLPDVGCAALDGVSCSIHRGRPLACRLYPLRLERDGGGERLVRLEGADGSTGVYGDAGTVGDFLAGQDIDDHLALNERYRSLLQVMRERVTGLVDFEAVEPREFWRRAVSEALRETNFDDDNPIIDAMFDADGLGCARESITVTVEAHFLALTDLARRETNATAVAEAAVLLAVSLGYSPAEAITNS
jgi:Fe-S-cluster containining protein